mmetsp:Transcript_17285/g.25853  ORF Transcript_17285/g.25853 Transcript_17285/m.25853 type:complete len:207 (+) Transcript_17285:43-663(+)
MSTKRKRSEETRETKRSDDEDQEFQDFLDSVDDPQPTDEAPAEDDGHGKKKDFEDFMGSIDNNEDAAAAAVDDTPRQQDKGEDATVDNDDVTTTGVDGQKVEEVEQVAYEARLAKLMLLSRRKKGDIHMNGGNMTDNTAREVGTGLVMNEEEETNEGDKSSEITEIKTLRKPSGSSLLKDIMKKKQKKKRTSKQEVDHDDTYWSNF